MNKFNDNLSPNDLVKHIMDKLMSAIKTEGGVAVNVEECSDCYHVFIFPSMRELVGGKDDGRCIFPSFVMDLKPLLRCFDKTPKFFFDTAHSKSGTIAPFVIAFGRIKGVKCDISIASEPPEGQSPMERAYIVGPKAGTVEQLPVCEKEPDE